MTSFDIHRGGRPPATPCPSDLDLALFVEGTLSPDSRDRLVMHLAECDDCREVVATVVAAQEVDDPSAPVAGPAAVAPGTAVPPVAPAPSRRRAPGIWVAALAVAATAAIALRVMSPGPDAGDVAAADASVWTELAQAVGPVRMLKARLSGLPAHVPLKALTRPGPADAGLAAQAVAARLAERAALPTADAAAGRAARHAAAVAALVAGRAGEAVTRLDAVLADTPAMAPERADLLADLAAAHAALAGVTTRDQWTAALNAAEEALAMDAAHEAARFNRALALERLARREAALAAWRDIAADAATATGWRGEAARHARALVP